ncbi:MAG: hypothetical protein EA379_02170 [Phycisphaerales bacterium]|nr:MAG: hypothetical protein EA379_02170 [Phycisphaerales bacterium]
MPHVIRSIFLAFAFCATPALALAAPINSACPMSGEAVPEGAPTIAFDGDTVGFCCAMCRTAFQRLGEDERRAAVAKVRTAGAPAMSPAPAAESPALIVNDTCPISDQPIGAEPPTLRVGAYSVAFCCGGCPAQFRAWDTDARNAYVAARAPRAPINEGCPVSGRPVAADAPTIAVGDEAVGFCCERCPPRFEAWDEDRRRAYVNEIMTQDAMNTACPVSGAEVDSSSPRLAHRGAVVAFKDEKAVNAWRVLGFEAQDARVGEMRRAKSAINAMCPIGEEAIDGRTFLTYKDNRIGFCCPGCDTAFDAWSEADKDAFVAKQKAD